MNRTISMLAALALAGCAGDDEGGHGQAPVGGPTVCALGQDCPLGEGCGSDGLCHQDGECTSEADCQAGELCYNAGNDVPDGICASARPSANPYCRSDGQGACRYRCYTDGTCGQGATCAADGFCHFDDECTSTTDCTPNHVCLPLFDYGISSCQVDENPACVDDGQGTCRWACAGDPDCIYGGGCAADGFCHGSNECDPTVVPDTCGPDQDCWPDEHFGGLCGAPRPD
jgi:hypothetical protein